MNRFNIFNSFNKEQFVIFLNNFFIVIGILTSLEMFKDFYNYSTKEDYMNCTISLLSGIILFIISFYLLIDNILKSIKPFINMYKNYLNLKETEIDEKIKEIKEKIKSEEK